MMLAKVKKWQEFQHYKDRAPPWIKLQRSLLDDYEYACLPLASKALAPMLWLIASESTDGTVRIDHDWLAFRLRWSIDDIREGVTALINKGFLVLASDALAACLQDACLEVEGETEVEKDLTTPNGVVPETNRSGPEPPAKTDFQEGATDAAQPDRARIPVRQIVELYHSQLPMLPKVEKLTKARIGHIQQRWREDLPSLEAWKNYLTDVSKSNFLTGKVPGKEGKPPFRATLEWLCLPGNFAKVSEGQYHR